MKIARVCYNTTSRRHLTAFLLIFVISSPLYADKARAAYKRGVRAETKDQLDTAFQAYREAHELKPKDPKYLAAYVRLRFQAASEHVRAGQMLRDSGKLQDALAEFQHAVEIDGTSSIARAEAQRTADMILRQMRHEQTVAAIPVSPLLKQAQEAEGPIELKPLSPTQVNLHINDNADVVYKIICKLAGINVLFDSEYRPQRINLELNDVIPLEALNMVALQSKTFWQPVSPNSIFVTAETKRKELQDNVMTTFYLRNVSTPNELQEAANTLKGILDISHLQLIPNQNAMVLRGTADQMVLAEKLLTDIDKPKPEVVIDVAVMQVSRERIRNLGVSPPTSASIVMVPGSSSSSSASSNSSSNGNQLTLNSLARLDANNFLVSIPGASLSFLMSDSNTKLIQNPEIRALDNEKATLKIGDRVPVATGSFASGIGGGGISPLVNTQFQYLDVGVNIDIVPHIHSEREVTLKMVLEISSVTGSQNIGGISQPIIGQRRIEHETRLQDGDVNLVGGILEDSETRSLSGYPWLTKVPLLKYFFGQEEKDRRENEIVFAITPHIVRSQDLTEENLRVVHVGNASTIRTHHKERGEEDAAKINRSAVPPSRSTEIRRESTGYSGTNRRNGAPRSAEPLGDPAPIQRKDPKATTPAHSDAPTTRSVEILAPKRTNRSHSSQALNDPCPYGQHPVAWTRELATCAFD